MVKCVVSGRWQATEGAEASRFASLPADVSQIEGLEVLANGRTETKLLLHRCTARLIGRETMGSDIDSTKRELL